MESLVEALEKFRGRRVLVTGSTGFKGSWLCTWLIGAGAEVVGFSLSAADDAPLFKQLRCEERMHQVYGDIRDMEALRAVFREWNPEIVIHLAAQALVRLSYEAPTWTFDTNVKGGVNLLQAVHECPSVRALVFVTSDKCYLNKEWEWSYRENDELGGADPYSASKAVAEVVFSSYQQSFFASQPNFSAATARAGNVIGGGDFARDRIVPDCLRALMAGSPIVLRSPNSTRPWQHVLEPLSGYLVLASRLLTSGSEAQGSWNFAPDAENIRTVHQLAEQVLKAWGSGVVKVERPDKDVHEAQLLMLSSDMAKTKLGWLPRWNFGEAVDATVDWYRAVNNGDDALAVTNNQIAAYVGK